jgi:hypothetical protein
MAARKNGPVWGAHRTASVESYPRRTASEVPQAQLIFKLCLSPAVMSAADAIDILADYGAG